MLLCLLSGKWFSYASERLFFVEVSYHPIGSVGFVYYTENSTAWANLWRKAGARLVETTRTTLYRLRKQMKNITLNQASLKLIAMG